MLTSFRDKSGVSVSSIKNIIGNGHTVTYRADERSTDMTWLRLAVALGLVLLVAGCGARCATGTESEVLRSTNDGRSFQPANGRPTQQMMLPNTAAFAAASGTVAVVAGQRLYRTNNAGASYDPLGPTGYLWQYLGFTDSTHGAALAVPSTVSSGEELYYTTNAGLSYHRVRIG